jgi:PAS domain S-box-containing protein
MIDRMGIAALAVEVADALVVALDARGRIVAFNPACERTTGFSADEVIGREIWDVLIPEDDHRPVGGVFDQLVATMEPSTFENAWLTKSGDQRIIAWRNAARRDSKSGELVVIGTGVDVTELRASEASLRDRASRLESLLRASRDGVITILATGEITSFSAGAENLFGYASSEVIGCNVSMLMPEPYRSAHDGYLSAYLRTGEARIIGLGREVIAKRKDGAEFPIHLMVEEGRLGETRFFTGVIRDLSERRALELSLQKKEAQFEAIFNAAPDAFVITDAAHRIVMVNPAFGRVFKRSPGSVVGEEKWTLYDSKEAYEQQWLRFRDHQSSETPRPSVARFLRSDGETFPGEIVRAELHDAAGVVLGHLALIRDVSEEQRREEALRQAQKMEAIGQLTGGMAHDFNNLLTVIKGNLELLEVSTEDEAQRELIAEARGATDMGASLTGRMLAFARRQPLQPQTVDINALVVSLCDLLRRTLGERVQLSTSLEPRLALVLVDPAQLQNAVLNLALNARDAMPGGGSVAIETSALAAPDDALLALDPGASGGWATLSVSDTGRGIAPEVRERLFDPYVTTKAPGQGGGLGLAMVFGFVRQSGGHIAVRSEPGAGATFTIYMSCAAEADTAADRPGPSSSTGPAPEGGQETILLVEDNAAVRRLTRRRLEGLGYRVLEAGEAAEALERVRRGEPFNLLLTDIVMPGEMDGIALAKATRKSRPSARVLFTSGYADPKRVSEASGSNGAALLRKPSSLAELAAAVRLALKS